MLLAVAVSSAYTKDLGGDFGFDRIHETLGACRGAVGLVKSRTVIVANDDNAMVMAA